MLPDKTYLPSSLRSGSGCGAGRASRRPAGVCRALADEAKRPTSPARRRRASAFGFGGASSGDDSDVDADDGNVAEDAASRGTEVNPEVGPRVRRARRARDARGVRRHATSETDRGRRRVAPRRSRRRRLGPRGLALLHDPRIASASFSAGGVYFEGPSALASGTAAADATTAPGPPASATPSSHWGFVPVSFANAVSGFGTRRRPSASQASLKLFAVGPRRRHQCWPRPR